MRDSPDRYGWEREFEEFFAARKKLYVRIAYSILGSWAAAEDATQDAFVTLYAKWRSIKGDSPDPYARRVLVNTCVSQARRRRREVVRSSVPEVDQAPTGVPDRGLVGGRSHPADPVAGHELRLDVMSALLRLKPRDRAILALRYLHDLSVSEVAQTMGIAEGTVKSRASRALNRLREELPDHGPPTRPATAAASPSPSPSPSPTPTPA